jgi:hypothetical protein
MKKAVIRRQMRDEKRLKKILFSIFLRWHDPDQVPGFDLSPGPANNVGGIGGTPLTETTLN